MPIPSLLVAMVLRPLLPRLPAVGAFAVAALVLGVGAIDAAAQSKRPTAVIFVSPGITILEEAISQPRMIVEDVYLRSKGYQVEVRTGTQDAILKALLDADVRAMSYFGHGSGSTMENLDAAGWIERARPQLFRRLRTEQGLSIEEARDKIDKTKFDKDLVRNFSCHSLADTSLAKLFVKPGGSYFGTPRALVTCPTPRQLLSDEDFFLTEYKVEAEQPTAEVVRLAGDIDWSPTGATHHRGGLILRLAGTTVTGSFAIEFRDARLEGKWVVKGDVRGQLGSDGALDARTTGRSDFVPDPERGPPASDAERAVRAARNLIRSGASFGFNGVFTGRRDAGGSAAGTLKAEGSGGILQPKGITARWNAKP